MRSIHNILNVRPLDHDERIAICQALVYTAEKIDLDPKVKERFGTYFTDIIKELASDDRQPA